jgi:hypothetical protein
MPKTKEKSDKIKPKKSLKSSASKKSLKSKKTSKSKNEEEEEKKSTSEININNNNQTLNNNNQTLQNFIQTSENNQTLIKCDGCFINSTNIYCKDCEKCLCNSCDNQLHIIPAFKNHEKIPFENLTHLKKLCYHHNFPLKYFCESCVEPVCEECKNNGPHNTRLHLIKNLIECYKEKYFKLNEIIKNEFKNKYEHLTKNLNLIENKMNEIENKSFNIEKNIFDLYNNVLEMLKNEKGKKLAILNFESANIQKDLVKYDDLINFVKEIKLNDD